MPVGSPILSSLDPGYKYVYVGLFAKPSFGGYRIGGFVVKLTGPVEQFPNAAADRAATAVATFAAAGEGLGITAGVGVADCLRATGVLPATLAVLAPGAGIPPPPIMALELYVSKTPGITPGIPFNIMYDMASTR